MKSTFYKFTASVSLSLALSLSAVAQDTPVEKELEKLFDALSAADPHMKDLGPEEKDEAFKDALEDFRDEAPKWTEEDAKKLKAKQPLVDDFKNIKKFYNNLDFFKDDPAGKVFLDKINNPKITNIEKRLFADMLVFFEKMQNGGGDGDGGSLSIQALNNGKDIYVGIRDYAFNNAGATPGERDDKKSANEIFNMLLKAGHVDDERPFLISKIHGFNNKVVEDKNLKKGENIFAINVGTNIIQDKADTPLLIAPLVEFNGKIIADKTQLGGQAIIICIDGSGTVCDITDKGEILDEDGKNILDPKHAVWNDRKQDIRLPLRLPIENKEISR